MSQKILNQDSNSSESKQPEDKMASEKQKIARRSNDTGTGVPIEHYPGEPGSSRVDDPGDLEEETLDSNAPFNKTYGLKNERKD